MRGRNSGIDPELMRQMAEIDRPKFISTGQLTGNLAGFGDFGVANAPEREVIEISERPEPPKQE